jgi:signal transduction histidine kinase
MNCARKLPAGRHAIVAVLLMSQAVPAQQYPLRNDSTRDGMPHDCVSNDAGCIEEERRRRLHFATKRGVHRLDLSWQRPWVVILALALAGGLGVAAYRLRKARGRAADRVRSRIAADLHDDVGAILTQLVLLSEKIQRAALTQGPELQHDSARMAVIARGLADSLSDFVWSVDARNDGLPDLLLRMRSLAGEMHEDAGLMLQFDAPIGNETCKLKPAVRRHLYLIFKEAIRNVACHAGATQVRVALEAGSDEIRLTIADDGIGFAVEKASGIGNGLENMAERTSDMGGVFLIESEKGKGTVVRVEVPSPFSRRFYGR